MTLQSLTDWLHKGASHSGAHVRWALTLFPLPVARVYGFQPDMLWQLGTGPLLLCQSRDWDWVGRGPSRSPALLASVGWAGGLVMAWGRRRVWGSWVLLFVLWFWLVCCRLFVFPFWTFLQLDRGCCVIIVIAVKNYWLFTWKRKKKEKNISGFCTLVRIGDVTIRYSL